MNIKRSVLSASKLFALSAALMLSLSALSGCECISGIASGDFTNCSAGSGGGGGGQNGEF